jgi:hypothetical protein
MGHTLEPLTALMLYASRVTSLCIALTVSNSILQRLLRLADPPYAALLEEWVF